MRDLAAAVWLVLVMAATLAAALVMRIAGPDSFPGAVRALLVRSVFAGFLVMVFGAFLLSITRRLTVFRLLTLFSAGCLLNLGVTVAAMLVDGPEIAAAMDMLNSNAGFVHMRRADGAEFTFRVVPEGGGKEARRSVIIHRPVLKRFPDKIARLLETEDARFDFRAFGPVDLESVGRATVATLFTSRSEGASTLPAQVFALATGLSRGKTRLSLAAYKARKVIGSIPTDDLYTRDHIRQTYLELLPMGQIGKHRLVGVQAGSLAFFSREAADLSWAQGAILCALVRGPSWYWPYQTSASDTGFMERRERLRARAEMLLRKVADRGYLNTVKLSSALAELSERIAEMPTSLQTWMADARLESVWDAVRTSVPDADRRFLQVDVRADAGVQQVLDEAVHSVETQLRTSVPTPPGDLIVVDAAVIDARGGLCADHGLIWAASGPGSALKPELYGLAADRRVIRSAGQHVEGVSVRDAIAQSINPVALNVIDKVGPEEYSEFLSARGIKNAGPVEAAALGAGVAVSPAQAASELGAFNYVDPGFVWPTVVATQIVDGNSGQIVLQSRPQRIFSRRAAILVREGMEAASLVGTARVLRSLAEHHPVATKTGTASFFRQGRWLGGGGSWAISTDSATGFTVATRVRFRDSPHFTLDGGQSAALVNQRFLTAVRARRDK